MSEAGYEEKEFSHFDTSISSGLTEELVETIQEDHQCPFWDIDVWYEFSLEGLKEAQGKAFI